MSLFPPPYTSAGSRAVGIVANAYGDPYSIRIMQGAAQELVEDGFHAVCCMGGFPSAPIFRDEQGEPCFPGALDACILLCETLRGSEAELESAARKAQVAVTLGVRFEGVCSVTANVETGVFQAVAHLVKRHNRSRIAFISGPDGSVDGERRLSAYRVALESLGIAPDPALLVAGDYETHSGREAIRQLRQQHFDAIVAANDLMAIGAVEALQEAGLRVPEQVSIVGFDDIEEASFAAPSLSTIRQPLHEQGVSAGRLVAQQLSRTGITRHEVVSAPFIVRESCGCASAEASERGSHPPGPNLDRDRGLLEDALRELVRRELTAARLRRELARVAGEILGAPDYPELAAAMTDVFGLLGLKRFWLCIYAGGQRHVRVVLESSGRGVIFRHHSQPFGVEELLPPTTLNPEKPCQLLVEPLEIAGEQLGYLVLEGNVRDAHAYLELRRHVSSALGRLAYGRELRRLYASEKKRVHRGP